MRTYKIEADDVYVYHKIYHVEANSIKEAKQKLDELDYLSMEDRAGCSFEKVRVLKIERTQTPNTNDQ